MKRIDLLNYSEQGNHQDLLNLLKSCKQSPDILTQGIFKCIESKDFSENHLHTISILINHGADLSFKDSKKLTSLMLACYTSNLPLVKLLLNNKANPFDLDKQSRNCISLCLMHRTSDPISILIELYNFGADINNKDINNNSPLHYAAENGHYQCVKFLLNKGADANCANVYLDTPLHLAFRNDCANVVRVLWAGADHGFKNFLGKSPVDGMFGTCLELFKAGNEIAINEEGSEEVGNEVLNEVGENKGDGRCSTCKSFKQVFCGDCFLNSFVNKSKEFENQVSGLQFRVNDLETQNLALKVKIQELNELVQVNSPLSGVYLNSFETPNYSKVLDDLNLSICKFLEEYEVFVRSCSQDYLENFEILKLNIEKKFDKYKVEMFGSFTNGLFLPHSDLDLVVIPDKSDLPISILEKICGLVSKMPIVIETKKVFNANFPILKLNTKNKSLNIKIDITVFVNKHKGKECSQLISYFLGKYPEIKPAFLVLKQLMYVCEFNEPFKRGMNSYGLFLMLVYYYQEQLKSKAEENKQFSFIFVGFIEFFTTFNYKQYIAVDTEWWDNKQYKYREVKNT